MSQGAGWYEIDEDDARTWFAEWGGITAQLEGSMLVLERAGQSVRVSAGNFGKYASAMSEQECDPQLVFEKEARE